MRGDLRAHVAGADDGGFSDCKHVVVLSFLAPPAWPRVYGASGDEIFFQSARKISEGTGASGALLPLPSRKKKIVLIPEKLRLNARRSIGKFNSRQYATSRGSGQIDDKVMAKVEGRVTQDRRRSHFYSLPTCGISVTRIRESRWNSITDEFD
jgi:hypothetical protein